MYIPKTFQVTDSEVLAAFIRAHSFATLVSAVEGTPFATHLPLLLDEGRLLGHVARANPHWRAFDGQQEALAIFHGPHAYISPTWYTVAPAVPTWNYAAVHVYGIPRLIEGEGLAAIVDRLVAAYEAAQPAPWSGELPAEYRAKLLQAIVGFELEIVRIEGKFKLGQGRSQEDQLGVLARLDSSADPIAQALGALTREQCPPG
jgi:transcriptional regulator